MTTPDPLKGTELIDCARANGNDGIEVSAQRCGYEDNLEEFQEALKQACDSIGVEYNKFDDLLKSSTDYHKDAGLIIAPETPSQL
jgi:acylphosphatase